MSTDNELPPLADISSQQPDRVYRTSLEPSYYLRLEDESLRRGLRPYRLVKIIVSSYLDGRLVYLSQLPEQIQKAIQQWQSHIEKTK
jgi:hypothetical protein